MISTLPRIILITFLLVLFIPNFTFAETKTFIKEYTYQASEFDSKASSRTIALEQAKRLLLEELGSYLESNTEVKNFELTKDRITALTAGIVQTQIIDEKWDGKSYWLKAKIKADPEKVAKSIDALRKDQKKSDALEAKIKKLDEALKETEKLRSEVVSSKDDIQAKDKYSKSVDALQQVENPPQSALSYTKAYQGGSKKLKVIKTDGRFIAYANGTVLDTRTNLMWAAKDNGADINWSDAKSYCENYKGGGYTDWRMPTQDELVGLYDKAKTYKSACNYDVHLTELIRPTCSDPWASETSGSDAAYFNFYNGLQSWFPQSYASFFRALPVRSSK